MVFPEMDEIFMSLEQLDHKRKRLIFRAGHRGTREMDLLLGSFAQKSVPGFDGDALVEFEDFLGENDPDLYNWITGQEEAPSHIRKMAFFEALLSHKFQG